MSKPSIPIPDHSEASAEDVEAFYDVVARMSESELRGFAFTLEQGRELERRRISEMFPRVSDDQFKKVIWG